MRRYATLLLSYPTRLWRRFYGYLIDCNQRAVAEWGASLQYRRRYTNPEDAKRYRRAPDA